MRRTRDNTDSEIDEYNSIELQHGWTIVQNGVTKLTRILEGLDESPFTSEEYINIYTIIYNMCELLPPDHYAHQLYMHNKYKQLFTDYIERTVLPSLKEKHGECMLRELVKRLSNHKVMVRWMSHFFNYLERYFIPRTFVEREQVGYILFHDLIYRKISGKAKDAVRSLINVEREGGDIDRMLLKNVRDMNVCTEMGPISFYDDDFEALVLADTVTYYSNKASIWILEDSCPEYLLKSEECLVKEKHRLDNYLPSNIEQKLLEIVKNQLLLVFKTQLLEKECSGCHELLKYNEVGDLSRMYRLYSEFPNGLNLIVRIFKQYVTDEGMALVLRAEDAAQRKAEIGGRSEEQIFGRKAIELHDKVMAFVKNCFQSHTIFHEALIEAFEVFLNKGVAATSSAVLLSTFCDSILKKGGSEKLSNDAIEDSLEKVVKLLAYVTDKDLFAEFHRRKLGLRLLFDKSVDHDLELSILTRLKQQYGGQFTSKMEGMVTDLTMAKKNQTNFEQYLEQNSDANLGLDLTVTVLNTLFWPSYKSSHFNLPDEMVNCVEVYKQYYQTISKDRKLSWVYSLGTCNIIGKFAHRTTELIVGTYQAAALMLFNTRDRLSYAEIAALLCLADEDLVRVLQSLSCAKYKILIKEPSSRTVSNSDYFSFNSGFTDKMRRIRIPLQRMDERKTIFENVDKERGYIIDASIVRIMKSRNLLGYEELISQCLQQLRLVCKPQINVIAKRIGSLIIREYIKTDNENPLQLQYLA